MKQWYPIYLGIIALLWFLAYPAIFGSSGMDARTFALSEVFGFGASWAAIHIAMYKPLKF